jgi:hypothetical protein
MVGWPCSRRERAGNNLIVLQQGIFHGILLLAGGSKSVNIRTLGRVVFWYGHRTILHAHTLATCYLPKVAVHVLSLSIKTGIGFEVPVQSPLHPLKVLVPLGVAVRFTVVPVA